MNHIIDGTLGWYPLRNACYVSGFNFGTITKLMQFSYLSRECKAHLQLPIATSTQFNVAIKYVFLPRYILHMPYILALLFE